VSLPDAVVLEATSVEALAANLIDLVIGRGESGESGARPGPTRRVVA
jgi:hypothetical protein